MWLVHYFCWIRTPVKFLKCVTVKIDIDAVIDDSKHHRLLTCKDTMAQPSQFFH